MLLMLFLSPASFVIAQPADQRLDDNEILEAVESELRFDDAIAADTLDVKVERGVVELSGTAFTLLSKRRAVRLVSSLKGVRAVVDRAEVLSTDRSDESILVELQAALRDDAVVDENAIDVRVERGKVILSGTVDSFVEKQLTEAAIAGVRGVLDIDNQLTIEVKADRPDHEIQAEILRRFMLNPFLAEGLIEVQVEDGNVTLSGVVGSANESEIASLLSWVAGVRRVGAADIEVKWWLDRERRRDKFTVLKNDIELRRAVEDALLYDPRVTSKSINVRAKYGAVTLLGNISSLAAKHAAEADVGNTLGVRRVINHLKVKVPNWPGDLAVTERAQQALARDAHLADFELRASSHFGTVYLSGEVNNHFEKARAEAVVANVPGTIDLDNRITVDAPWQPKPDDDIREDVMRRLRWSPLLDASQITVSVDDGVVTLQGVVDTWHERTMAERHAHRAGARRVIDELDVRSGRMTLPGLTATLLPNRVEYELDKEFSGEKFREFLVLANQTLDAVKLPPAPKVDLVFRLHNEGDRPVEVRLGHDKGEIELSLTGPGAVHVSLGRLFVADFRPGRVLTIEPNGDFEIPIRSLQYGFRNASDRWYWTEAGEYLLQATLIWPTDVIGVDMRSVAATPVKLRVDVKDD